MKSTIKTRSDGLEVDIKATAGAADKLRVAFSACAEGRCGCPTDEYKKLAALEVDDTDEGMRLRLKAKEGERIDPDEVSRCLVHTEAAVASDD